MRYINRSGNSNALVGIFLLILLAVFIGPGMLPRLASSISPAIDESIPCAWLRDGGDLAYHQSLIGRAAQNPIRLTVRTSAVPTTPDGVLAVSIVIANESLGTVPIVYNPNQVIVGDNGTSGLGIIFTPNSLITNGATRVDSASFPENDIRVLGPRQRCIHRMEFQAAQVAADPTLASGGSQVRAFYRINAAGQVIANPAATAIYPDQGLNIVPNGYIESQPVSIPVVIQ